MSLWFHCQHISLDLFFWIFELKICVSVSHHMTCNRLDNPESALWAPIKMPQCASPCHAHWHPDKPWAQQLCSKQSNTSEGYTYPFQPASISESTACDFKLGQYGCRAPQKHLGLFSPWSLLIFGTSAENNHCVSSQSCWYWQPGKTVLDKGLLFLTSKLTQWNNS